MTGRQRLTIIWVWNAQAVAEVFDGRVFLVGEDALSVASGDFNEDGLSDLAVSCYDSRRVSLLRGDGWGRFAPASSIEVDFPESVLAADLDWDGQVDLAVGRAEGVSVFFGNGDGTFSDAFEWETGCSHFGITIGDYNEDGLLDVLLGSRCSSSNSGHTELLLNKGDRTFEPPVFPGGAPTTFVVSGDFDGDLHLDFVTAGGEGIRLYRGNGDSTFAIQPADFNVGADPVHAVAGYFNLDERADLAVLTEEGVNVYFGSAMSGLETSASYAAPLRFAFRIGVADLNADGSGDLVATGIDDDKIQVLLSNEDGTFQAAVAYATLLRAGAFTAGDYNRDGRADLAIASYRSAPAKAAEAFPSLVWVARGDGLGGLVSDRITRVAVGANPSDSVVVDLDGSGRGGIVTANAGSNDATVLLTDAAGTVSVQGTVPVGMSPKGIAAADINGAADATGRVDVVVANEDSDDVSVLIGLGDGEFEVATSVVLSRKPAALALGTLNADPWPDLVTSNPATGDVAVLLGAGDGTFGEPSYLVVGEEPVDVAIERVNQDEFFDIVTANRASSDVSVLLGKGDGTFAPESRSSAGMPPTALAAGDLDGDGSVDLVLTAGTLLFPPLVALKGYGDGTFHAPVPIDISARGVDVTAEDFDGDGLLDLAVAHVNSYASLLLGTGDGTFKSASQFAVWYSPSGLATGDLDGDGRRDLVVSSIVRDDVTILRNRLPILVLFDADRETLSWPQLLGADFFNVYRGDIQALKDTNHDGVPDLGYGACQTPLDPDPSNTSFVDATIPDPGHGFFYLMTRVRNGVELDLGTTSLGQPRVPSVPCESGPH